MFRFHYKDNNIEYDWEFSGFGIKPERAFHEIMDRLEDKFKGVKKNGRNKNKRVT